MKRYLKSGDPSEDLIQCTFFDWIYLQQEIYPDLQLMYHIPNGGSRNPIEAKKLKRMGVRRSIPDVFMAVAKGAYHGLYIEFKSAAGEQALGQVDTMQNLKNHGYFCTVCHNANDAIEITKKYLGI
jgi:hypothetical protein